MLASTKLGVRIQWIGKKRISRLSEGERTS